MTTLRSKAQSAPQTTSPSAAGSQEQSKADVLGPHYSIRQNAWHAANRDTQTASDQPPPTPTSPNAWFSSMFHAFEEPFNTMKRLTENLDREVESFMWGAPGTARRSLAAQIAPMWSPCCEVVQTADGLKVTADLPGIDKADVTVEIQDGQLLISGERRSQFDDQQDGRQLSERSYGRFVRSIALPEGVDAGSAQAHMDNGVLEITLAGPIHQQHRIEIMGGTGRERPSP
ncbi:MAG: Hsp20/alpha crystallin family protein [Burkholderiales bacterium]|nr:Hsp20/alpha crystallin family protein [Burkholderiales bacterium]